jgi:hypothetical protein
MTGSIAALAAGGKDLPHIEKESSPCPGRNISPSLIQIILYLANIPV